ncbi:MAG: FkbM family methyltransferase [Sphingobacteriales bacterium]|uniref:FkbM family methyltransferase n=1 Tax=Hydrotalea flava TaxID=714549 RepID=UPI00082ED8A1|nr:FkbM family methyltransferase [Hydrotalea flava]RTL55839.1 MAG: FkbM family methyltransferase [Sphingobacteriales bacterium]
MFIIRKVLIKFFEVLFPKIRYIKVAYSQEGEDLILLRLFPKITKGFYIDIGAHHPFRFSNTYIFYKRKWRGINIDPRPGAKKLFDKYRPDDINLDIGISESESVMKYYMFSDPAINTFSEEQAQKIISEGKYKFLKVKDIPTYPLSTILDKFISNKNLIIDFMTIDVEGFDLEVLKSNNWDLYRPKFILVESHNASLHDLDNDKIFLFLKKNNYAIFAKTVYTFIYKDVN